MYSRYQGAAKETFSRYNAMLSLCGPEGTFSERRGGGQLNPVVCVRSDRVYDRCTEPVHQERSGQVPKKRYKS